MTHRKPVPSRTSRAHRRTQNNEQHVPQPRAAAGEFWSVIPAGGSGTRLWPVSRSGQPKFLLPLIDAQRSLLQETVERLRLVCDNGRMLVVGGPAHAAPITRQLPEFGTHQIVVEPSPKGSGPAIALAAALIARQDPNAVMGSFAADHDVRDTVAFANAVRAAIVTAQEGWLVTIGIQPTRPETGYGYIERDQKVLLITPGGDAHRAARFIEKPDLDRATGFVKSGRFLWNASMFIWRVDVFLAELARQQPQLHAGLMRIAHAWDTPDREGVLGEVWPSLPKISVDYAVMEGAAAVGLVATVPGDFGWNDVGDFHTLGDVLERDEHGNVVVEADDGAGGKSDVLLRDTERTVVVPRSGRLVSAVGVHDMIIVDTPDALLVCPRERAQDVKKLVDSLKERGNSTHL
jgi:mannose-1-phosphate guanylyltransferase